MPFSNGAERQMINMQKKWGERETRMPIRDARCPSASYLPAYVHIYTSVRVRHAADLELDTPLLIRMALALSNGEATGQAIRGENWPAP